jgi:glycosyltransferase involved in cell wall biosynthesis
MKVVTFNDGPIKDNNTVPRHVRIKRKLVELIAVATKMFKHGSRLPIICVFGHGNLELVTPAREEYEEEGLDCRCYPCNADVEQVLIRDRPCTIITIANRSSYPNLAKAPFEIRKRWLHYDTLPDLTQLGKDAYNSYLANAFNHPDTGVTPLVTVFTPTYKTGRKIFRPFMSLEEQTYANWEWIIVDDSDDNGETFKILSNLARKDHRLQVFKPWEHSGIIGRVKNWACSLGNGSILVELDHDDELTVNALDYVVQGLEQYPEAGFLYTDCAEVFEDGTNLTYRNGWAFGYGSYTDVEYKGKRYKSGNGPNVNAKTIRHIVSSPNHIRAWRKSFYESIGGHSKELQVADDYEIIVRTFLTTLMVRVPKLCYIQYIGNTRQQVRNKDIQRHVRSIRVHYDRAIHDGLLELGCEDFIWDEKNGCSDYKIPNPEVESHATLIANV